MKWQLVTHRRKICHALAGNEEPPSRWFLWLLNDHGWSHATKDGLLQMVNIRFRHSTAACGNNAESELRWSAVAAYGVISEFGCRAPLTDGPKSSSSVSHFTFLGASSRKAFNRGKGERSLSLFFSLSLSRHSAVNQISKK